jgi:hypothetical protein
MDYHRIDEINVEAELYVMEFMRLFEEEMQGNRLNLITDKENENALVSIPTEAEL